jgi:hypothetical protein
LTARLIDLGLPFHELELFLEQVEEVHRVHLFEAIRLADLVVRGPEKVGVADPGDLDRILERQEQARLGPCFRLEIEQILPPVPDGAAGDLVGRVACQYLGQRALAGSVGTHDRVHLARIDREVDAPKDFLVAGARAKVSDFQHRVRLRVV